MSVIEVAGKGKQACKAGADSDRISNLPSPVTERILECLPLQDAVRTSLLSRHWRYKWVHLPQLILDHRFFLKVFPSRWGVRSKCSDESHAYTNVVNNILVRHIGPIRKFVLSVPRWVSASTDISHWIEFVAANGVKELTLENNRDSIMNLPSSLFFCAGLRHLELYDLQIYLFPPSFTGFPCLSELRMRTDMTTDSDAKAFGTLISSCPQLESLNLHVWQETKLTICARKLQHLVVKGFVTGINLKLKGTTQLRTVSIRIWYDWSLIALYEFLCCLPNVEMLHLVTGVLKDCLHRQESPKFSNDFRRLTSLKLKIVVNCLSSMSLALRIFESSPHLQQLAIEVSAYCQRCGDTSLHINDNCNLQSLKNVAIVGIKGLSNDLKLIKLLLGCSPALDVMTIELNEKIKGAEEKLNIARELMLYPRASSKAQIVFKS